jgi:AcrR family transcriptional regulator
VVRGTAAARLLRAAAELTYQRGLTAAGVDAIAQRAGVTKRTLYQHFASKDELVAASLDARDQASLDGLRHGALAQAASTGEPPVLAMFDQVQAVLAGPGANGCAFLNAALEMSDPGHPAHQAALRHLRAREQLVADLLATSGIDEPGLADELVLLLDGAFVVGATRGDPAAAARAKRAAAALIASRQPASDNTTP